MTEPFTQPGTISTIRLLGVRVHMVQIPDVVRQMEHWICERTRGHFIAFTNMHGMTEAQHDATFKEILNSADLDVPDGMPLVWLSRIRGYPLRRRVYGPEFMLTFCEQTCHKGYRHFFYGGVPGVPEKLAQVLSERYPGLQVVGTYSPPFRPLNSKEQAEVVAMIRQAAPDVLWVGMGDCKQERWMYEYRSWLEVPVMAGVGAAFDFNIGRAKQAPPWMRERGLEWLFRLWQEPRRLWRRYLVSGSKFVGYVALELLHLKKFE